MVARINISDIKEKERLANIAGSDGDLYNGKTSVLGLKELGWKRGAWEYFRSNCGKDCYIGDYTTLVAPFTLGDNVWIGNNCYIGKNCKIGNGARIDAGVTIPENTEIPEGKRWTFADSVRAVMVLDLNKGLQ